MRIIVKLELDVLLHDALKAEAEAEDSPVSYYIESVLAERQEYRRNPPEPGLPYGVCLGPRFVRAVVALLPEEWLLYAPTDPDSCVWRATPPGPVSSRWVGIVDAPSPSVDCRTAVTKIDSYRPDGVSDRMLPHYVGVMRELVLAGGGA